MKKTLVLISMICAPLFLGAQNEEIEVKTTVKEVTLYLSGAQELRQGKVNIPAGNSILKFTSLPNSVNPNSIRVRGVADFTILSVNYRQNYIYKHSDIPEIKELNDSIESTQFKIDLLSTEKSVLNEEKSMFASNRRITGNNGLVIDDLHEISGFISDRLRAIEQRMIEIRREETKLNTTLTKLNNQLNLTVAGRQKATGEILVNINSKTAKTASQVQLTYLTTNASWRPFYDVRANEVGGPVEVSYRANVMQQSGTDWENVELILSTATPNVSNTKPHVPVWFLDFDYGQDYDKSGYFSSGRAVSNFDLAVDESESGGKYQWDFGGESTVIAQNAINTEFKIKSAYSIPSDGMPYVVEIGNYDFKALYEYSTVPKFAENAFLLARITGYFEYSFLPAQSNIYYKGTYVGKSYLNTNTTSDTLNLSMGSDEGIVIKRKNVSDVKSKSTSGSTHKQSYAFEISIRNTKSVAVEINVEDQVPVSKQKEIVVELDEDHGGEFIKESGKLKWKLKLGAGETKTLKFSYTVKYPKNFVISNL